MSDIRTSDVLVVVEVVIKEWRTLVERRLTRTAAPTKGLFEQLEIREVTEE